MKIEVAAEQSDDWKRQIEDALGATEFLIGGLDFDTYTGFSLIGQRRGVERCVEIVARHAKALRDEMRAAPVTVNWELVESVSASLRQGRLPSDDFVVWQVATEVFPEIRKLIDARPSTRAAHSVESTRP